MRKTNSSNAFIEPMLSEVSHLQGTTRIQVPETICLYNKSRKNMDISEEKQNSSLGRWLSS